MSIFSDIVAKETKISIGFTHQVFPCTSKNCIGIRYYNLCKKYLKFSCKIQVLYSLRIDQLIGKVDLFFWFPFRRDRGPECARGHLTGIIILFPAVAARHQRQECLVQGIDIFLHDDGLHRLYLVVHKGFVHRLGLGGFDPWVAGGQQRLRLVEQLFVHFFSRPQPGEDDIDVFIGLHARQA